ncbi:MAG: aspartyl/glutamyl-tRNA amidotransferase subunit C [Sediminibacterium sp.]|nr:aspartyl/glutamyl-tRNA amidotransferase subunit C [Sediminibacterium sp.]
MNINNDTIYKLADLSYLNISNDELPSLKKSLETMLGLMNSISEVTISEKPLSIESKRSFEGLPKELPLVNLTNEAALQNVKNSKNGFILVPKIIQN